MFERFTHPARAVVITAQEEARRLNHPLIGTEHLLLALLRQGEAAADVLRDVGVTADQVEVAIDRSRRGASRGFTDEDAEALRAVGIDLDEVRARIEENFGPVSLAPPEEPRRWRFGRRRTRPGEGAVRGHVPFSPRAKKVLELSLREAIRLKHKHIGAEHILLGLIREDGGLAAVVLAELEVDTGEVRRRTEAALRAAA